MISGAGSEFVHTENGCGMETPSRSRVRTTCPMVSKRWPETPRRHRGLGGCVIWATCAGVRAECLTKDCTAPVSTRIITGKPSTKKFLNMWDGPSVVGSVSTTRIAASVSVVLCGEGGVEGAMMAEGGGVVGLVRRAERSMVHCCASAMIVARVGRWLVSHTQASGERFRQVR